MVKICYQRFAVALTMLAFATQALPCLAQTVTKIETPEQTLKRADFEFWAIPETKHSLVKNTPVYKEYWAYVKGKGRLIMDPNAGINTNDTITVEPFIGAASSFSVRARFDNNDLFPNQQYIWSAPGYYIPVIPTPTGDASPGVRVTRTIADAVDTTLIVTNPGFAYANSKWDYSPTSLVIPGWWEHFVEQMELSASYQQPPTEWRADVSEPDKTFHWNYGNDASIFPKDTEVSVGVTGSDPGTPAVAAKVKIKWFKPPQLDYELELSAAEWQRPGDTTTFDDWTMFWASAGANQKLMDQLAFEGSIGAVAQPIIVGAGQAAKVLIKVTLSKAASSPFVAHMVANALEKAIAKETAERALTNVAIKTEVRASERGINNSIVQSSTDRRVVGSATTVEERVPRVTREPGGCFIAGTPVVMADGSLKPIEQIRSGDKVLSRDPFSGKTAARKVKGTTTREVNNTLRLFLSDGQQIEATANHPFFGYVPGQGKPTLSIIEAGHLPLGTSLITRAGPEYGWHTLSIAKADASNRRVRVFNFEVEDFHTYFVGKDAQNALWVHNQTPDCPNGGNPAPGIEETTPTQPATDESQSSQAIQNNENVPDAKTKSPSPDELLEPLLRLFRESAAPRIQEVRAGLSSNFKRRSIAVTEFEPNPSNVAAEGAGEYLPSVSGQESPKYRAPDAAAESPRTEPTAAGTGQMAEHTHPVAPPAHTGPRQYDSEVKLIEEFAADLDANPQMSGVLRIYCDPIPACDSCRDLATWFNTQSPYADRANVVIVWDEGYHW